MTSSERVTLMLMKNLENITQKKSLNIHLNNSMELNVIFARILMPHYAITVQYCTVLSEICFRYTSK